MIRLNTLNELAESLRAKRAKLQQCYEQNAQALGYDHEEEPSEDDAIASVLRSEFQQIRALDHALELHEQGLYGHCELCRRAIAVARLRAIPHATYCIKCQRDTEFTD